MKKIRQLYFLQILKLQKIKWSYFLHKTIGGRDARKGARDDANVGRLVCHAQDCENVKEIV